MKDIKGFEGLYAITSCGKVWSYRSQKFMSPYNSGSGYLMVDLCVDGIRKKCKVHRLVAEAYIPNPEGKPQVNHIDECKTHNWVGNLEWATAKENINHGTRNERAGKNIRKPVYCVELNRVFESVSAAAAELGLHQSAISNALAGRFQTSGGYHWRFANEKETNENN